MPASEPVYLASDVHFGATRPEHEDAFLAWLDFAAERAASIVLNGDLFDFWFEYRAGIPHGYERLLARLSRVADAVPVTLVGGNHDWWGGRYLREEIGLEFLRKPVVRDLAGRRAFLAHGDGLGAGDLGYRWIAKPALRNPLTTFAFGFLPVAVGDRLAGHVSNTEERWNQWGQRQVRRSEALEAWATAKLLAEPELDLVLLGHTHLPMVREVAPDRWYVNSGDWVYHKSWVVLTADEAPTLHDWDDRTR